MSKSNIPSNQEAMQIKTAWRAMSSDEFGRLNPGRYFWSFEEAKLACSGWGSSPDPKLCRVLVTDSGIFPLNSSIDVYGSFSDVIKERALAKLSDEERAVLGV